MAKKTKDAEDTPEYSTVAYAAESPITEDQYYARNAIDSLRSDVRNLDSRLSDATYRLGEITGKYESLERSLMPLSQMLVYGNEVPPSLRNAIQNIISSNSNDHVRMHEAKMHRAIVFSEIAGDK